MDSNVRTLDKIPEEFNPFREPEISPCPSKETCELINSFLDESVESLERKERIQTYGLDYSFLDLLCMKDNAWETFRRLI